MSYSASDFQSNVEERLVALGYSFHDDGEDDDAPHYWSFGHLVSENRFSEGMSAVEDALEDYLFRVASLQLSAAGVLNTWSSGDLAESVRELQADLDASIPGDINEFVEAAT